MIGHGARTRPVDEILDALAVTLPIAAVLVGEGGRVLWMNREAEVRLGVVGRSVGRDGFCATVGTALSELVALAQCEIERPGSVSANARRLTWLAPGESVVARRVSQPGAPSSVLICSSTPGVDRPLGVEAPKVRPAVHLTARETQIAALAAEGCSVVTIANRLGIAESTVSSHLKRIYKKLDVCSRVELAAHLTRVRPLR